MAHLERPEDVRLIEQHVRSFNHGVRTGDWEPMLARFAWSKGGTGTMRFEIDRGLIRKLAVAFDQS